VFTVRSSPPGSVTSASILRGCRGGRKRFEQLGLNRARPPERHRRERTRAGGQSQVDRRLRALKADEGGLPLGDEDIEGLSGLLPHVVVSFVLTPTPSSDSKRSPRSAASRSTTHPARPLRTAKPAARASHGTASG
jgi:hypothetical protein